VLGVENFTASGMGPGRYEGPPLFVNSDAFVNIVMPALTLQNNYGPTLFVNSDAFVSTARVHTQVPLE
jgi:hypothetical protein